jgi:HlyD family secretion protein
MNKHETLATRETLETLRRHKRFLLPLAILALAAAVTLVILRVRSGDEAKFIRVSGNIEVTDAEVSFKIPGRVEARLVDEGELVKQGQVVARLDQAELAQEAALRAAEVQAAQAALAELLAGSRREEIAEAEAAASRAKARLDELLAGSRPEEVTAAEAVLRSATAEAERLEVDYGRYKGLFAKQLVSAQQFDAARTAYEMARARQREAEERLKLVQEGPRKEEIDQARAAWRQAAAQRDLVVEGARKETIEQARARLEQAKQARAIAETRLSYATLKSPLAGVVLSKNVEPGEYVAAGTPIVTVGDLENVWLRAYIDEPDLGRVKVGQPVRVTTDTFPHKVYDGRVSFLSSQAEFTPKSVQTDRERVRLVYRVKVDIRNPQMELKPGMPADAEILLTQEPRGR